MEFIRDNWPYVLVVIAVALALVFIVLRPKQSVRLTDSAPVRPHMNVPRQDRGLAGEANVAAAEFIHSPVHRKVGGVKEPADDDLTQIKGIGPKFADALQRQGFHRFEQLARLTAPEIERLEPHLGVFSGRMIRDRIVEQADYLARNDIDGFEQRFGKL